MTPLRIATLVLLSTPVLLMGCSQEREDLPDWSEGYETSDTASDVNTAGSYLQLATPDNVGYETITHPEGDWVSDCSVETDGSLAGYEQKTCYIEIEELDLYASNFQFSLEASGCDYVAWSHYIYEAWEVGVGPTEVSYTIDKNGFYTDENNSQDGVPFCQYNYYYWDAGNPNCCTGSYNLTITDESKGKTEYLSGLSWGDRPWECYSGAAFIDPDALFNDSGWPMDHIVRTNLAYYSKNFSFDPLSERFFSNVNLANYYDPDDHVDGIPPGHDGLYSRPNYTLQCLDHAEEELARIDFIVREWNTEDEFALGELGNPEEEGDEPKSDSPLNDRADWADWADDYVKFNQ